MRERERLSALLATEQPPAPRVLNVEKAIGLLNDIPALIDQATYTEQRGLIQQVVKQMWLTREGIAGWEPAPNYHMLVEVVVRAKAVDWTTSAGLEAPPPTATPGSTFLIAPRWVALNTPLAL